MWREKGYFNVYKSNTHYTYSTHSERVVWGLWVLGLHMKSLARSPGQPVMSPTFWPISQWPLINQGDDRVHHLKKKGVNVVVLWVTTSQGLGGFWQTAKITSLVVGRIGEMKNKEECHFCTTLCSNSYHIVSLMISLVGWIGTWKASLFLAYEPKFHMMHTCLLLIE